MYTFSPAHPFPFSSPVYGITRYIYLVIRAPEDAKSLASPSIRDRLAAFLLWRRSRRPRYIYLGRQCREDCANPRIVYIPIRGFAQSSRRIKYLPSARASLPRLGIPLSPRPSPSLCLHQISQNIVDAGQVVFVLGAQPIEHLGWRHTITALQPRSASMRELAAAAPHPLRGLS